MKTLPISKTLSLPVDVVTDTIGILSVKGSGKTYAALVLLEQMVKAGLPVVALDPVGVFWGLRSSVDGKHPGLPVIVLGGHHADAPLEPTAGRVIADFIVAERAPCVLDLSGFGTKAEHLRFARDFLDRLYEANRDALHVMIDEADDLAPQRPFGEEARVLRAVEVLVRRGRARGLGCTLITQRAAVLNKNVLTQVSTLILGRTTSPQDRKAVEAWVDAHGTDEQKRELMASLAALPTREKWVWCPTSDIFQRIEVRARETFDSSATPAVGAARVEPKALAEVDLAGLRSRIAAPIEKAKADDPKALRARIVELGKQLAMAEVREAAAKKASAPAETKVERVEVPVLDGPMTELLARVDDHLQKLVGLKQATERVLDAAATRLSAPVPAAPTRREPIIVKAPSTVARVADQVARESGTKLASGERKILSVLARSRSGQRDAHAIALFSLYAPNGGGFRNLLGALRTKGWIVGTAITDAGRDALGPPDVVPHRDELLALWSSKLGKAGRLILAELFNAVGGQASVAEIAERTGYEATGGGFRNALGRLRSLQLTARTGDVESIANVFFEESP